MQAMYVFIVGGGKVGTYLAALLLTARAQGQAHRGRPAEMPTLQRELPPGAILTGDGTDPACWKLPASARPTWSRP